MSTQPERKAPYLDLYECIARYPRIAATLAYAGFSITEIGAAIRDYRLGSNWSSEAIDHTGGTRRAIEHAVRFRSYARAYQHPDGYSRRRIAEIRAEHYITKAAARQRDWQRAADEAARRDEAARQAAIQSAQLEIFYQQHPDARPTAPRPAPAA